ncbi:hypothetical protein ACFYUR_22205 [Micromonospora haikouensis]|uniref:hypothetical protein n=1 Tax=Micromonospora haikouensis TaxID=686309 RepID=UPI0036B2F9CB
MRYLITGTVPPGSPAAALAGKTIRIPVTSPDQGAARIAEAVRAGIRPTIRAAR